MAMMRACLAAALCSSVALADLVGIPIVPFTTVGNGSFDLRWVNYIVVDTRYANVTDTNGWTLIPPTLDQFAMTFAQDLVNITKNDVNVADGHGPHGFSIFLTLGNCTDYRDAAGRWTSEAYTLEVFEDYLVVTGASPLGVWWGTRTVLQQAVLNNGSLPLGKGVDSPGWNTRGIFVGVTAFSTCRETNASDSSMLAAITTRHPSLSKCAIGSLTGNRTPSTSI